MSGELFICYIDPGTGSFVAQVAAAAAIGIIISIKSFWLNIKLFFTSLFSKKQASEDENSENSEDSGLN